MDRDQAQQVICPGMRRLLRDLASGQGTIGDTTTLEDFSVLAKLREEEE